jgi:anti-sigma B factor antagonist
MSARRREKVTIFELSGYVDYANSRQLRESVLREILEIRTPQVVVNLSAVRYIDSSGVASLVEALKASRNLGVRFILFGLSTPAREVLQLSRLIKVFEICETEEQAAAP